MVILSNQAHSPCLIVFAHGTVKRRCGKISFGALPSVALTAVASRQQSYQEFSSALSLISIAARKTTHL